MINPLRGEVSFTVAGREAILRPSMAAIAKWEAATGKSTWELGRLIGEQRLMTADLLAIVEAASVDGLSREQIGAAVDEAGLVPLCRAAMELVRNSLLRGLEPEPSVGRAEEPGEPRPT